MAGGAAVMAPLAVPAAVIHWLARILLVAFSGMIVTFQAKSSCLLGVAP